MHCRLETEFAVEIVAKTFAMDLVHSFVDISLEADFLFD